MKAKDILRVRLRESRISKNMTQQQLANMCGKKFNVTVCRWETGVSAPSYDDLVKLAKIFGTTTDWFLGRE